MVKKELEVIIMKKLMDRLYDNIDEAKAFELSFTNFVYSYEDLYWGDFEATPCEHCGKRVQHRDYIYPKASCKKPTGILDTLQFGVSKDLRDDLIDRFDVTEKDFRPIYSKRGELVYYQIAPQHVMMPIHEENGWIPKDPCPDCGVVIYQHNDFKNEKGEFYHYISQSALDNMHDFNVTYERFRWHKPICVISRRVYDFLTERYPRTHYVPFFLREQDKKDGSVVPSDESQNRP